MPRSTRKKRCSPAQLKVSVLAGGIFACLAVQGLIWRQGIVTLQGRIDQLEAATAGNMALVNMSLAVIGSREVDNLLSLHGAQKEQHHTGRAVVLGAPGLSKRVAPPPTLEQQRRLDMFVSIVGMGSSAAHSGCVTISLDATIEVSLARNLCNGHRCPPCWIALKGHPSNKLILTECSVAKVSDKVSMGASNVGGPQAYLANSMLGVTFINTDRDVFIVSDGNNRSYSIPAHSSAVAYCYTGGNNSLYWPPVQALSIGNHSMPSSPQETTPAPFGMAPGTFQFNPEFSYFFVSGQTGWDGISGADTTIVSTLLDGSVVFGYRRDFMGQKFVNLFMVNIDEEGTISMGISKANSYDKDGYQWQHIPYSTDGGSILCMHQEYIYCHTIEKDTAVMSSMPVAVFGEHTEEARVDEIKAATIYKEAAQKEDGHIIVCFTKSDGGYQGTLCGKVAVVGGSIQQQALSAVRVYEKQADYLAIVSLDQTAQTFLTCYKCTEDHDPSKACLECNVGTVAVVDGTLSFAGGVRFPVESLPQSPNSDRTTVSAIRLSKISSMGDKAVMCMLYNLEHGPPSAGTLCMLISVSGTTISYSEPTSWWMHSSYHGVSMPELSVLYLKDNFMLLFTKVSQTDMEPEKNTREYVLLQLTDPHISHGYLHEKGSLKEAGHSATSAWSSYEMVKMTLGKNTLVGSSSETSTVCFCRYANYHGMQSKGCQSIYIGTSLSSGSSDSGSAAAASSLQVYPTFSDFFIDTAGQTNWDSVDTDYNKILLSTLLDGSVIFGYKREMGGAKINLFIVNIDEAGLITKGASKDNDLQGDPQQWRHVPYSSDGGSLLCVKGDMDMKGEHVYCWRIDKDTAELIGTPVPVFGDNDAEKVERLLDMTTYKASASKEEGHMIGCFQKHMGTVTGTLCAKMAVDMGTIQQTDTSTAARLTSSHVDPLTILSLDQTAQTFLTCYKCDGDPCLECNLGTVGVTGGAISFAGAVTFPVERLPADPNGGTTKIRTHRLTKLNSAGDKAMMCISYGFDMPPDGTLCLVISVSGTAISYADSTSWWTQSSKEGMGMMDVTCLYLKDNFAMVFTKTMQTDKEPERRTREYVVLQLSDAVTSHGHVHEPAGLKRVGGSSTTEFDNYGMVKMTLAKETLVTTESETSTVCVCKFASGGMMGDSKGCNTISITSGLSSTSGSGATSTALSLNPATLQMNAEFSDFFIGAQTNWDGVGGANNVIVSTLLDGTTIFGYRRDFEGTKSVNLFRVNPDNLGDFQATMGASKANQLAMIGYEWTYVPYSLDGGSLLCMQVDLNMQGEHVYCFTIDKATLALSATAVAVFGENGMDKVDQLKAATTYKASPSNQEGHMIGCFKKSMGAVTGTLCAKMSIVAGTIQQTDLSTAAQLATEELDTIKILSLDQTAQTFLTCYKCSGMQCIACNVGTVAAAGGAVTFAGRVPFPTDLLPRKKDDPTSPTNVNTIRLNKISSASDKAVMCIVFSFTSGPPWAGTACTVISVAGTTISYSTPTAWWTETSYQGMSLTEVNTLYLKDNFMMIFTRVSRSDSEPENRKREYVVLQLTDPYISDGYLHEFGLLKKVGGSSTTEFENFEMVKTTLAKDTVVGMSSETSTVLFCKYASSGANPSKGCKTISITSGLSSSTSTTALSLNPATVQVNPVFTDFLIPPQTTWEGVGDSNSVIVSTFPDGSIIFGYKREHMGQKNVNLFIVNIDDAGAITKGVNDANMVGMIGYEWKYVLYSADGGSLLCMKGDMNMQGEHIYCFKIQKDTAKFDEGSRVPVFGETDADKVETLKAMTAYKTSTSSQTGDMIGCFIKHTGSFTGTLCTKMAVVAGTIQQTDGTAVQLRTDHVDNLEIIFSGQQHQSGYTFLVCYTYSGKLECKTGIVWDSTTGTATGGTSTGGTSTGGTSTGGTSTGGATPAPPPRPAIEFSEGVEFPKSLLPRKDDGSESSFSSIRLSRINSKGDTAVMCIQYGFSAGPPWGGVLCTAIAVTEGKISYSTPTEWWTKNTYEGMSMTELSCLYLKDNFMLVFTKTSRSSEEPHKNTRDYVVLQLTDAVFSHDYLHQPAALRRVGGTSTSEFSNYEMVKMTLAKPTRVEANRETSTVLFCAFTSGGPAGESKGCRTVSIVISSPVP